MKKWNIPQEHFDQRFPNEILQEYADALPKQSQNKLTGQVTETISYDSEGFPKLYYAFHVYINALKQSYRLFEVEQISENAYPVNLKVILLSGTQVFPSITSPGQFDNKLEECVGSVYVGNLIRHLIHLSDLKNNPEL